MVTPFSACNEDSPHDGNLLHSFFVVFLVVSFAFFYCILTRFRAYMNGVSPHYMLYVICSPVCSMPVLRLCPSVYLLISHSCVFVQDLRAVLLRLVFHTAYLSTLPLYIPRLFSTVAEMYLSSVIGSGYHSCTIKPFRTAI